MKRYFFLYILLISVNIFATDSLSVSTVDIKDLTNFFINDAKTYIGAPYHYGGHSPQGFDCSGFVGYMYERYGFQLPRTSSDQSTKGYAIEGDFTNLQKGDLLFFGGRSNNGIGHVGLFIELDDTLGQSFSFIHAANGGVQISHYNEIYYKQRYRFARRILPTIDKSYAFDTTAVYPFDSLAYILPYYINVDSLNQRIILFTNGRWAYVDESGKLTIPDSIGGNNIILSSNGYWCEEKQNGYTLPTKNLSNDSTSNSSVSKSTLVNSSPACQYHKVKSGDTLSGISRKYGTTIKQLCKLNNIKETSILKLGQSIRVK